ncbi:MAG: hypothetical protein IT561_13070 [Alphaproteobacteria bacterium]|nr:hypothetical protein [Alphaproteobacteria bacterium]
MTHSVAVSFALLLCAVALGAVLAPASAQFAGATCVTRVGTCIVPAIPRGSVCFCGSVQGIIP